MKRIGESYVALENKEEVSIFLVNGKHIIDYGTYPRYFQLHYYWFYDRNFPMWKEISQSDYQDALILSNEKEIAI